MGQVTEYFIGLGFVFQCNFLYQYMYSKRFKEYYVGVYYQGILYKTSTMRFMLL